MNRATLNLYYTVNYNGQSSGSYEHGYLADMYSWRLGPPKLRQFRVNKGNVTHVRMCVLKPCEYICINLLP